MTTFSAAFDNASSAIATTLFAAGLCCAPVAAGCPPTSDIETLLRTVDLEAASRTTEHGLGVPWKLISKALEHREDPAVRREGNLTQGVIIADLPIEQIWMAINDEDHHTLLEDLSLTHSEVVGGTSRGQERLMFQSFSSLGVERWWLNEIWMNEKLYARSGGSLWEHSWRYRADLAEEISLPLPADSKVQPIRESWGTWLLVPLSDSCTLVECVNWSDPGGALSAAQWILARRLADRTMSSMVDLAREHIPEPHEGARFVRPDGSEIMNQAEPVITAGR